jgi:hypothetical protein
MTTTTIAPPSAALVALGRSFDTAAQTPTQFGLEALFGRWTELRIASAHRSPDILAGVSFATVIDAVLDYRSSPEGGFNVLKIAAETRS